MALSVGIETLIAIPFKLRPLWKVSLVNLLTQIILIVFMRCSDIPYLTALIIGEAYVYISEFVAYSYLYKIPKWKLAVYTVVANTFTLALGIIDERIYYFYLIEENRNLIPQLPKSLADFESFFLAVRGRFADNSGVCGALARPGPRRAVTAPAVILRGEIGEEFERINQNLVRSCQIQQPQIRNQLEILPLVL